MAREVEHRNVAHGTVAPHDGGAEDLLPVVPNGVRYHRKDWTELRPPASTRTQETWAKIVQPVRALLLAALWLSYTWWRVAIFWLLIATLAALLWIVVTGS